MPAETIGDLYLAHQDVIEAVIRSVCRVFRFSLEEAEDFAQTVRLRLIDPQEGTFDKFRRRSSLKTYLTVVVTNWARDVRVTQWGRWRPSPAARRAGPPGIRLEMLVVRDGIPADQAVETVLREFDDADVVKLSGLAADFRPRKRRTYVSIEDVMDLAFAGDSDAEQQMIDDEEQQRHARLVAALAEATATLDPDDRLLLQLCYEQRLKIADIARTRNADQKQLYRRREDVLRRLRKILKDKGLDLKDEDSNR